MTLAELKAALAEGNDRATVIVKDTYDYDFDGIGIKSVEFADEGVILHLIDPWGA